jgi:hypothetical protein
MTKPNHYQLHGDGITVSYYPEGSGPVTSDGRTVLTYHRGDESRDFTSEQVTQASAGAIGAFVTVQMSAIANFSKLYFSVLLPEVNLDGEAAAPSEHVNAVGIMTTFPMLAEARRAVTSYEVTHLKGVADVVEVPLTSVEQH